MTKRESYAELKKVVKNNPELVAFLDKELEKEERRFAKIRLETVIKLVDSADIKLVEELNNDLVKFATKNLENLNEMLAKMSI